MKRITRLIPVILTLWISPYIKAQSVASLEIMPDAQTLGMANASLALKGNAASIYKNMSAVSFADYITGATYSFTKWYGNNRLHALSGYHHIHQKHSLALGLRYFDSESVNQTTDGITKKQVNPYDLSLDLGYAYRVTNDFSFSINIRYIHSKINEAPGIKRANAIATDLGLTYRKNGFGAAASLNNLGTKIDYGYKKYHMPTHLNIGVSYEFAYAEAHEITGSLEGNYRMLPSNYSTFGSGAGVQYRYNKLIAIRGGYHISDKRKSTGNYGVIGCGLYTKYLTTNFAYVLAKYDSIIKDVWQVSLGFYF